MSCRASGLCLQHEIPIKEHWSLSAPIFSPSDYRILFSGADDSGTGEPDVFLLDFAPDQPNQPIVNLTTHIFISDGVNTATWTPEGKILDICFDGMSWEINVFCIIDPLTGNVTSGELIYPKLGNYRLYGGLFWLSPTGSQVATTIFPKNGTRDSLQELRLVDLNGHLGPKLAESQWIEYINFSPAGEWLAYVTEEGARLYIADVNTGNSILVQELPQFHISFVGWVR
jgi:Tol biopolymer transport system component